MFECDVIGLPQSRAPERYFTLHHGRLERPHKDEHSSLLGTFVNYDRKKFITLAPGAYPTKPFSA